MKSVTTMLFIIVILVIITSINGVITIAIQDIANLTTAIFKRHGSMAWCGLQRHP